MDGEATDGKGKSLVIGGTGLVGGYIVEHLLRRGERPLALARSPGQRSGVDWFSGANRLFAKFDVPIAGYVVNRVLPAELAHQNVPEYIKNRITMQDKYMGAIRSTFGQQVLAYVPELERDVTGLPAIERLAGIMYGD